MFQEKKGLFPKEVEEKHETRIKTFVYLFQEKKGLFQEQEGLPLAACFKKRSKNTTRNGAVQRKENKCLFQEGLFCCSKKRNGAFFSCSAVQRKETVLFKEMGLFCCSKKRNGAFLFCCSKKRKWFVSFLNSTSRRRRTRRKEPLFFSSAALLRRIQRKWFVSEQHLFLNEPQEPLKEKKTTICFRNTKLTTNN